MTIEAFTTQPGRVLHREGVGAARCRDAGGTDIGGDADVEELLYRGESAGEFRGAGGHGGGDGGRGAADATDARRGSGGARWCSAGAAGAALAAGDGSGSVGGGAV